MNSDTAFSKDAHELAVLHGAEPGDIEALCSRDALLSILTEANIEADICEDVADTCDLSNLNALAIASGVLSTEQIAQFCFLTQDEAEVVFSHCAHKAFHGGVTFGRASVAEPSRLGTFRRSPKAADAVPSSFSDKDHDTGSGPFGADSLKFDSPSKKRGQKARPAVELSAGGQNVATSASESSPRRGSMHMKPVEPLATTTAAPPPIETAASTSRSQEGAEAAPQQVPPIIEAVAEPPADNLANTGVSNTSSSAPSSIPTPSLASTRSSVNKISPHSFDATDSSKEATISNSGSMPVISAPAAAAAAAPSPLATAGDGVDSSLAPSELVAPVVQPEEMHTVDKSKSAVSVPTVRTESGPNSPQTPREASNREMLKVESCQLNTSSSVPPQRDPSIGNALGTPGHSALPSPSAVTGAAALELQGVQQSEHDNGSTHAYAGIEPPASAPAFVNGSRFIGHRSLPSQQDPAMSRLANGAVSGMPPPMRSPRVRAPPVQTTTLKSPRATPRPITPPARGRQGRQSYPQTIHSNFQQEGLEELGSTFLKFPGGLPSFMRPTAAHEHRVNPAEEEARDAARTPSPPRRSTRSVNPTARFIQPTASYSAKATNNSASTPMARTPMARAHSAAPVCTQDQALRQAHTPTSFAPFCLHTEMRLPQRNRKTTDELRVADAKKAKEAEAVKRRAQLERLQKQERARTESPKVSEASAARSRAVKPFQLASVMRHERDVQNRKAQLQRQLDDEAKAKQFRARQFNPAMHSAGTPSRTRRSEPGRSSVGPHSAGPRTADPRSVGPRSAGPRSQRANIGRPVTAPKPHGNRPDARHSFRHDALEGEFTSGAAAAARRAMVLAREDERKQEAAQAAREREFKANMGPNSVGSHRLDIAKAKPTTIPKPFKLSGSKVVHSLTSENSRSDMYPPTQLCTPQGVMTEFARSLRNKRGE